AAGTGVSVGATGGSEAAGLDGASGAGATGVSTGAGAERVAGSARGATGAGAGAGADCGGAAGLTCAARDGRDRVVPDFCMNATTTTATIMTTARVMRMISMEGLQ